MNALTRLVLSCLFATLIIFTWHENPLLASNLSTPPRIQQNQPRPPSQVNPNVVAPASSTPAVTALTPNTLNQGWQGTLTLTGQNVNRITSVYLGQGIDILSYTAQNSQQALISVHVNNSAPLGAHWLRITTGGTLSAPITTETRLSVVVRSSESQPGIQIINTPKPDIETISPQSATRGATHSLVLKILRPVPSMTLDFGPGITLTEPMTQTGDLMFKATISVASSAPLGPRPVLIKLADQTITAKAGLTIIGSGLSVSPQTFAQLPATITAVSPNQWKRGQEYNINLSGTGFTQGMEVRFGSGVEVTGPLAIVNSGLVKTKVKVSGSASPGQRKAEIRSKSSTPWVQTLASAWISNPPALDMEKVQMPVTDLVNFSKGVIKLTAPTPYTPDPQNPEFSYPLNDETTFRWEELAPGLAEWFEFRIVTNSGNVLMKRRLDSVSGVNMMSGQPVQVVPNYYKPDQAFFNELCNTRFQLGPNTYANGLCGDLIFNWEVAGFRTYTTTKFIEIPGSTPNTKKVQKIIEKKDVEVEISNRWDMVGPNKPTGLACTGGSSKKEYTSVVLTNRDQGKNKPAGTANTVNYVNDRWQISGSIDLHQSPYASFISSPGGKNQNNQYSYEATNIFLDWGDGTIEPLHLESQVKPPYNPDMPLRIREPAPKHQYTATGKKVVRIFLLPQGNIQHINPGAVVQAFDAGQPIQASSSSGNPYFQVLQTAGFSFPGLASGPSLSELANQAYMIFCQEVTIDPRQDLVASGLLHLDSISITDYNGGDVMASPGVTQGIDSTLTNAVTGGKPKIGLAQSQKVKAKAPTGSSSAQVQAVDPSMVNLDALADPSSANAVLSQCDSLQANAALKYYGAGKAWVTWLLLDRQGGKDLTLSTRLEDVGPSPSRDMSLIGPDEALKPSFPASLGLKPVDSPILQMNTFELNHRYHLRVAATVDLSAAMELTQEELMAALQDLASMNPLALNQEQSDQPEVLSDMDSDTASLWRPGAIYAANAKTPASAKAKSSAKAGGSSGAYLSALAGSGAKYGVLSPFKESGGYPAVASVNQALQKIPGFSVIPDVPKRPPYHVNSLLFSFEAKQNSPNKPCQFQFTSKSGDVFEINNLQGVKKDGQGRYSGTGSLKLKIYRGNNATYDKLVPVTVRGWKLASDNINLAAGSEIRENLNDSLETSGMKLKLAKLEGRAYQTDLSLTLSATPLDTSLRIEGTDTPVSWPNKTARLTGDGDWFYQDNTQKKFAIGWTGFVIDSSGSALDLSAQKNHPAATAADSKCGQPGNGWVGIHLGNAKIVPFLANLTTNSPYRAQVSNWGISSHGLCGSVDMGSFSTQVKGGQISFDALHAEANQGNFAAEYKNMKVQVPWLNTELSGTAKLVAERGTEPYIDLRTIQGAAVTKSYPQRIAFTAKDFTFGIYPTCGWGVKANTLFSFQNEGAPLAQDIPINDVIFGLDGIAYLNAPGQNSVTLPLGGKSAFGATAVDLVSLQVSGFKTQQLSFVLGTTFSVSEVLDPVSVPITYRLEKDSGTYTAPYSAKGPFISPFAMEINYPRFGEVTVNAKMDLNYSASGSAVADQGARPILASLDLEPGATGIVSDAVEPILLASAATDGDKFNAGNIDLRMFSSDIPGNIEFRLGYQGGHDYWLLRASVDIMSMPVAPPYLYMHKIRGGLGHNFPITAFTNPNSINNVYPQMDDSYLFMGGTRMGSADQMLYTFDGDLTIKTGEGVRLDIRAWLLTPDHGGEGQFRGWIQYGAGSFDGSFSGKLSQFPGDYIYLEVPDGAAAMHFGGEDWYIHAGKKEGPRVNGHAWIFDANAYLELSSKDGFWAGAGLTERFNAGNCDKVCAYVETYYEAGMGITLNPMKLSADFGGGASAGLCVWEFGCKGIGINYGAHAEVPPPQLRLWFSTSNVPCPVDSIDINVGVIPPGIGWDIDWCDCGIFDC